ELAEDVSRPASRDRPHDLVAQLEVVRSDVLEDVGGSVRVDPIGDDDVESEVVAVDGFKEQVVAVPLVPTVLVVGHRDVRELRVERVPVVQEGGKEVDTAGRVDLALDASGRKGVA